MGANIHPRGVDVLRPTRVRRGFHAGRPNSAQALPFELSCRPYLHKSHALPYELYGG